MKAYNAKQKRQARAIEASEKKLGKSEKSAERIGYATVNKRLSSEKKSGSGKRSNSSSALA